MISSLVTYLFVWLLNVFFPIEWKIHNLNEIEADKDFFDLKIAKPDLGSTDIAKVSFEPVEPEVAQDGPFQIIPQYLNLLSV